MKRVIVLAVFIALALNIASCAQSSVNSAPTWQEQYDLGVRYLSEGKPDFL